MDDETKREIAQMEAFVKTIRNAADIYGVDISEVKGAIRGLEHGIEWKIGGDHFEL